MSANRISSASCAARAWLAATRQHRPTPQPGEYANDDSVVPDIADVRELVLENGRQFPTKVAGLFLFLPLLLDLDLPQAVSKAKLPGSKQMMLSEDSDPGLSRRTAVREGSEPCLASLAQTLVPLGTLQNARSQAESSSWRGQS